MNIIGGKSEMEILAEKFLRIKEAALDILNELPHGLVIVDESGTIEFINKKAEFIFECTRGGKDGLIGKILEDTIIPDGKKDIHINNRKEFNRNPNGRPMRGVEGRSMLGRKLDLEVAINSVQTPTGKLSFAVIKEKDDNSGTN